MRASFPSAPTSKSTFCVIYSDDEISTRKKKSRRSKNNRDVLARCTRVQYVATSTRGTNIFVTLTRIFDQNLLCIVLWPAGRTCGIWANVPTASKKWFSRRLSFTFVGIDPRNIFRKALAEIRRFPVFLAFREAGGGQH